VLAITQVLVVPALIQYMSWTFHKCFRGSPYTVQCTCHCDDFYFKGACRVSHCTNVHVLIIPQVLDIQAFLLELVVPQVLDAPAIIHVLIIPQGVGFQAFLLVLVVPHVLLVPAFIFGSVTPKVQYLSWQS
jgi:hypothetical protein